METSTEKATKTYHYNTSFGNKSVAELHKTPSCKITVYYLSCVSSWSETYWTRTANTNRADPTEPFKERITIYINLYGDTSQFHKYRRHRSLFLPNLGYLADLFCFSLYDIFCLCYLSYSQKWNNLLPEVETEPPVPSQWCTILYIQFWTGRIGGQQKLKYKLVSKYNTKPTFN